MKKKSIIILVLIIAFIAICIGIGVYYYRDVAEVTDYFCIQYTPPVEQGVSFFGSPQYSDPKVELKQLPNYDNDSIAIAAKRRQAEQEQKFLMKEFDEEIKKNPDKDDYTYYAKIEALKQMLQRQYFVISFTHHRSYKPEDFLEFLKKNGIDWLKMEDFCKENDLKAAYYPI